MSMSSSPLEPSTFFPTPKEIHGSLQWMKRHPFATAATAVCTTAFTIYAYLRDVQQEHVESDEDEEVNEEDVNDEHASDAYSLSESEDEHEATLPKSAIRPSMQSFKSTASLHLFSRPNDTHANASLHQLSATEHKSSDSPQWGWYVSTTPPSEAYPKE